MENLAHTLFGLSLAKAGLERATPLATTALVISSNLPDIDVLSQLNGGTVSYIGCHRGFTHGFVGLAVLAAGLTFVLTFLDRRFRLRADPFRRPIRPLRILLLSYLGGLGHALMDFTNAYGVRLLEPFSKRWFYGDLVFVVDPWIWLILGSAVVWLTVTEAGRAVVWLVIGTLAALVVALALRTPAAEQQLSPIPNTARVIWFCGLALIAVGALLGWRRKGPRLARYSLFVLALYYSGMWMAQQSALKQAGESLPDVEPTSMAVWPTPANPLLWNSGVETDRAVFMGELNLVTGQFNWRELNKLDSEFIEPLRQSSEARTFLEFMRYGSATIEDNPSGHTVLIRDLRFSLQMRAELDADMSVKSVEVRW